MNPSIHCELLIPCYNASRHLPALADNLRTLAPAFPKVLCYDDGSTDDTLAVARSLGLPILPGGPNRGAAYARNRLAEASSAEWIHFHDADDLMHPHLLRDLAPLCTPQLDVVSCDADWLDAVTRKLLIPWRYDAPTLSAAPAPYLLGQPMGLNNTFIRRQRWLDIGGCDESLHMWEDADVHYRLALAGARWHHHPKVLTLALRRPDSFSHDYRSNWNYRLSALRKYAAGEGGRRWPQLIGAEAEKTARALLELGELAKARDAVRLSLNLGHAVPQTHHVVLRCLRAFLPAWWLLRLQTKLRASAPSLTAPPPAS